MQKISYTSVIVLFVLGLISHSCKHQNTYHTSTGSVYGTFYNVTYDWDNDITEEIDSVLKIFNKSLSNFDKNSVVSRINRNETDIADKFFIEMFSVAKEVYQITDAAFDITIAPIANLWSFGWKNNKVDNISQQQIDSALMYVGINKVELHNNKIIKQNPNIQFITGAIAKGQAVDYLSDFLKNKGITNFLVEIGGEIYCCGKNNQGKKWRIGIDKPIDNLGYYNRENHKIISISDKSIATSGNYRQYITYKGKKKGHLLDPRTGYPAENDLLSVTVVTDKCIYADAYATAFMVLGLEKSIEITETIENLDAYFIYLDDNRNIKDYSSIGFKKYIEP